MQDLISVQRNLETRCERERKGLPPGGDLWFTMWRVCAIVLCLVGVHRAPLAVVGANTQAEDPQDPAGCAPPLEFLVQHNVAAQEHLAQLPSNGKCGGESEARSELRVSARRVGRERGRSSVTRGFKFLSCIHSRANFPRRPCGGLGDLQRGINSEGRENMCRLPERNEEGDSLARGGSVFSMG